MISLFVCLSICCALSAQQVTREQLLKLFYNAQQARQTGNVEEAKTLYKQIINLQPRLPEPYLHLGDLYRADTTDLRSQEKAVALYGFYLQLKPEATDYETVNTRKKEIERRLTSQEQYAAAEQQPQTKKKEVAVAQVTVTPVEPQPAIAPEPEVKPVYKEKRDLSSKVNSRPVKNLTGRWVSTSKAMDGREAWILDIKEAEGEYWISINNKSAVKNTELFDAMTNLDIPGRWENDRFIFNFTVSEVYDPDKKGSNIIGSVGDFLGNVLGVDVFEWKLFANNKKKNHNLVYEYAFDLECEPYSLKGYIHTAVRDKSDTTKLVTNNTQACELFRAPMNYAGLHIPVLSEEDKRQNKELRTLFSTTQKQAETDVEAMNNLGCLYWSGVGTRPNMKKAADCFAGSAMENTHAQLNLALLYQAGNGVEKDIDKARSWYLLAAEKGYTDAFVLCGDTYMFGEEIDTNYDTALFYYDKAITAGSAFGLFRLGWLYKEGLGVKQDRSKALAYLEKAKAAGYTEACVEMAAIYEKEGNMKKVVELLEAAVTENNVQAMFKLSELYLRGEGVTQDFLQAKTLEEKALRGSVKILSGYNTLEPEVKDFYNRLK